MTAFIATSVNGREYVVVIDNKVVAGSFATVAEGGQEAGGDSRRYSPFSNSCHLPDFGVSQRCLLDK